MKIFITGAGGFIGTHLLQRLANSDHEVECLVRLGRETRTMESAGSRVVHGDVTDRNSLMAPMARCDWVVNLANIYSFWEPAPSVYSTVNIEGTRNVMEAALAAGVSKIAHVSSAVTYGKPAQIPFDEQSSSGPVLFSEYARTKLAGDCIAQALHEDAQLPLVTVYPGAVIGPGDTRASGRYIRDVLTRRLPLRVLEDATLSFVHVRDVAEVIVRALEKEGNLGERYLACAEVRTMGWLNRTIAEVSGVRLPRLRLPRVLEVPTAALLTLIANAIKKPPIWGMAIDAVRTTAAGFIANGDKVKNELGIKYRPVRQAIEEIIEGMPCLQNRGHDQ